MSDNAETDIGKLTCLPENPGDDLTRSAHSLKKKISDENSRVIFR